MPESTGIAEKASRHVERIPMVAAFLEKARASKLAPLFQDNYLAFMTAPAAATMHHNFTHGLAIHTAEVWLVAQRLACGGDATSSRAPEDTNFLAPILPFSVAYQVPDFTLDELFVAIALHDFAKIVQYEPAGNSSWKKKRMICNQETWTLRECAKHGIELSDNELVGLLHAEGGYTEFEVDWRPMSVIVHSADLWSSQAMRAMWDPAAEMMLMCPECGAPMSPRNGPRGPFYGCTKYPICRGIKDADKVPSSDVWFMSFLERNYPVPAAPEDISIEDLPF